MITFIGLIIISAKLLSIYFAIKNDIETWLFGGLSAVFFANLLISNELLFSFICEVITIVLCVIGLMKWETNQESNEDLLNVKHTALYIFLILMAISLIILFVPYNNTKLFIDALLSILSLIGVIMLLNHNIFAWVLFVIVSVSYIFIGLVLSNLSIALLYFVIFVLMFYGCLKNIMKYLKMIDEENIFNFF
jgi:nicotinamide riboside transporter PnuC